MGQHVVDIDEEEPAVELEDGTRVEGDLVLLAGGDTSGPLRLAHFPTTVDISSMGTSRGPVVQSLGLAVI